MIKLVFQSKNDQTHVEQKNWSVVRNLPSYYQFDKPEHFELIQRIYSLTWIYNNYFQSVRKLIDCNMPFRKTGEIV